MRRWYGGKWEQLYVEPCKGFVWVPVHQFGERVPCTYGSAKAREDHPVWHCVAHEPYHPDPPTPHTTIAWTRRRSPPPSRRGR
jgi:hypothetical protein